MSTKHFRTARSRLVAALLVVAIVAAACGNSEGDSDDGGSSGGGEAAPVSGVPGVTDDEIRFSAFGTGANNPTGACILDCYVDGIEAYFAYRNSEGGVHGRDMVLSTTLDDELSKNQERALEITSANDTFAAFSATQLPSGWHDITDAGMPLYVWGIHATEADGDDAIFANTGVICATCTRRDQVFAGTLVDATKVASLGYGVSQASKDCVSSQVATVDLYGDEVGQEMAYTNDDLAFGLPNGIAPEVTAMKREGVDFILACFDLNGMQTLAEELERQGMGDVPMLHANTYDQEFVANAGGVFDGDLVMVSFRPFEADPEGTGLEEYFNWMEETGSELTETAMIGWINADLAYKGLVEAGEEFDRASVIEATNQMTEFTADGLVPPIDWSRQHQAPTQDDPETNGYAQQCAAYVEVVDGEFEVVGEEDAPFWCWDGTTREWAEPESTTFG